MLEFLTETVEVVYWIYNQQKYVNLKMTQFVNHSPTQKDILQRKIPSQSH